MGRKVGFLFCFLETNEGLKFTFLLVECYKDLIMLSVIICLLSEMRTRKEDCTLCLVFTLFFRK
jgi:hypothetical protein